MVVGSSLSGFRRWPRRFARRTARFAGQHRQAVWTQHRRTTIRATAGSPRHASELTARFLTSFRKGSAPQPSPVVPRPGSSVSMSGLGGRAWQNYGTIFVDLERRRVADLLADRTTATTADWFKLHPETEIVSRDRAGMYADAGASRRAAGSPSRRSLPPDEELARGHRAAGLAASRRQSGQRHR